MRLFTKLVRGTLATALLTAWAASPATGVTVSGHAVVTSQSKKLDHSPVVVWLNPVEDTPSPGPLEDSPHEPLRLIQKHKQFHPHVLVVPAGATVEFPNLDPFFHNVFSLFDGKRFDLGLYEAGSTRAVRFDRPGICYIFCNIHPEMSAVIVVVKTPYYGVSNSAGEINIPNVPPGRYRLGVWQEAALPEDLKKLSREITIAPESSTLGTLTIFESPRNMAAHKNKYGRDYDEPKSPNSPYNYPQ